MKNCQNFRRPAKDRPDAFTAPRQRRAASAQRGKSARDQRFEPGADRLGEHRRGAVGRDADHQRRTIDDGAEGEVAEVRLVDHIDRHAGRAAGGGKALRLGRILAAAHRDRGAGKIGRVPAAAMNDDRAARRLRPRRRASSSQGIGAKTSTCAPAADSNSAFHAAAAVPPATSARLPSSAKNSGSRASGSMPRRRRLRGLARRAHARSFAVRARTIRNWCRPAAPCRSPRRSPAAARRWRRG